MGNTISPWASLSLQVFKCLMSCEKEMMKLFNESKGGYLTDEEVLLILMEGRLRKHMEECKAQYEGTINVRKILENE